MQRDISERLESLLNHSSFIYGLAGATKDLLYKIFQETPLRPLKLLLNGTPLEHPLHTVITDVPIGAWTVALVLYLAALLFGAPNLGFATGLVMAVGIVAALGAIASGFMDFTDIDPEDPKTKKERVIRHPALAVAMTHALVNITATILFAVAFFLLMGNGWTIATANFIPALLGYLFVTVGGFLGGSLVFRLGTMVNRNAFRNQPEQYKAVTKLDQLEENEPKLVHVGGDPVVLVRRGQTIHAVSAVCSHFGGPLDQGKLKDSTIVCPLHYSRFSILDGSVKEGPACAPLPVYLARVTDGEVEIKLRREA
jgi:nitrite reductase/ring-hydroxylating ferredoxin subunit/uncharacterized membrane protein